MRDLWFISDTHFGHEKILGFKDDSGNIIRKFPSIEDHDNHIIEKWNSTIKPRDIVYHLGDVFQGQKSNFLKIFSTLHGSKRLLLGNHDDGKFMAKSGQFQKVNLWRMFRDHGILAGHVPFHESALKLKTDRPLLNVHGHIHHNLSPTVNHFNVSCEAIDYTPIHIDEITHFIKWNKSTITGETK